MRVGYQRGIRAVLEEKRTEEEEDEKESFGENVKQFTCVMKFGGSSVASAERMKEIADLIQSFEEERPVIVLSAMGKTTNKLLLVMLDGHRHSFSFFFSFFCYSFICELHYAITHFDLGWRESCELRSFECGRN